MGGVDGRFGEKCGRDAAVPRWRESARVAACRRVEGDGMAEAGESKGDLANASSVW